MIKTAIEENWNGLETLKQLEKLEYSCLMYMKNMIGVIEKVEKNFFNFIQNYLTKYPQFYNNLNIFHYDFDKEAGIEDLLFYSDNLEVNYYVLKLYFKIYKITGISDHSWYNSRGVRIFYQFSNYFCKGLRE